MYVVMSDQWGAERQAVANTVAYVAGHMRVVPSSSEGMIAIMLELRPRWSKNLSRGETIRLKNERRQWQLAWAGCKVLKQGIWQVTDVLQ